MTMQKAVALAHLRVAYEPDDDDDEDVTIPAPSAFAPQLLVAMHASGTRAFAGPDPQASWSCAAVSEFRQYAAPSGD